MHATIRVSEVDENVRASILPSTPAALSIGRRCVREGFSFVWKSSEPPYVIRLDGMIVNLDVYEGAPYLSPNGRTCRPVHTAGEIVLP